LTATGATPPAKTGPVAPRIVAFAFSCEPDGGSEGGAGWIWARLLAGIGPTTLLISRSPHSDRVVARAAELTGAEAGRLDVVVVDPPALIARFIGSHSWPPLWYLEYAVFQVRAMRRARRLHEVAPFDISWHLTWANAWFGSLAGFVGPAFVFGPVGAGVGTPWGLIGTVGLRGAIAELARSAARMGSRYLNPVARAAIRSAAVILVQNPETVAWLPARHRDKAVVFPHVVLTERTTDTSPPPPGRRAALFAGRLLPWKGGELALRAMVDLPEHRLIICGRGPDEARLQDLSERLGVADRVEFRGWVDREDLTIAMREEASVFLFPSLHDEGGWVVTEARAQGLPVVCLDRGGPPILGGTGVAAGRPKATARRLARAVLAVEADPPGPSPVPTVPEARRRLIHLLAARGIIPPTDAPA